MAGTLLTAVKASQSNLKSLPLIPAILATHLLTTHLSRIEKSVSNNQRGMTRSNTVYPEIFERPHQIDGSRRPTTQHQTCRNDPREIHISNKTHTHALIAKLTARDASRCFRFTPFYFWGGGGDNCGTSRQYVDQSGPSQPSDICKPQKVRKRPLRRRYLESSRWRVPDLLFSRIQCKPHDLNHPTLQDAPPRSCD